MATSPLFESVGGGASTALEQRLLALPVEAEVDRLHPEEVGIKEDQSVCSAGFSDCNWFAS